MTEKEYKQLFLDPRYQNLSLHSTKDNLVYLVQEYQDRYLFSMENVPFKLAGILFEPDETIFGLKEFDVDKNMGYIVHLYNMKEFIFSLYSGDREAILMLLDEALLSNTCGKKFILGAINNLELKVFYNYTRNYFLPKWERIIKEKLYEDMDLNEIKFDAYNDVKALGILIDALNEEIDDVFLRIHSLDRRYFCTDASIRNTLDVIKEAKDTRMVALVLGELMSIHPFPKKANDENSCLNSFLISFLKENLNKKRKKLSLIDIKREEE